MIREFRNAETLRETKYVGAETRILYKYRYGGVDRKQGRQHFEKDNLQEVRSTSGDRQGSTEDLKM